MRIAFVGHICLDQNIVRGGTETACGGGVLHGAITAQRLGAQTLVLTKCAPADRRRFQPLTEAGVQVLFLPSLQSTSIRNVYPSENPDDRQSFLISRAAPFAEVDLVDLDSFRPEVVHVNPLWWGEFPPALLPALRRRAVRLAADAQGFVRVAGADGRLRHEPLADPGAVLGGLDLFKVDAAEARLLVGEEEPRRAARAVQALGPRAVLLTHRDGVCVCEGGESSESPFKSYPLEGRTGRGDTCTASFLVGRGRGLGLAEAAAFAAEITSRKMQYRGPYRG